MANSRLGLLSAAALAALAAGCSSAVNGPESALTYAQEHPISVDTQVVTLTLNASANDGNLSELDKSRINAFSKAYMQNGHGPVAITTPSGAYDEGNAQKMAASVRTEIKNAGVPFGNISAAAYQAGQSTGGDIIVSYTHYVATPSACGIWQGLRGRDYRNLRSPNFGCSRQNNLAAMISDPRDLIMPADITPPDSNIRIRGVQSFRSGEVTSSATDNEIEAQVSN